MKVIKDLFRNIKYKLYPETIQVDAVALMRKHLDDAILSILRGEPLRDRQGNITGLCGYMLKLERTCHPMLSRAVESIAVGMQGVGHDMRCATYYGYRSMAYFIPHTEFTGRDAFTLFPRYDLNTMYGRTRFRALVLMRKKLYGSEPTPANLTISQLLCIKNDVVDWGHVPRSGICSMLLQTTEFLQLAQSWPKFSGTRIHPVPSPTEEYTASDYFNRTGQLNANMFDADTQYGRDRIELLDFCIDQLLASYRTTQ